MQHGTCSTAGCDKPVHILKANLCALCYGRQWRQANGERHRQAVTSWRARHGRGRAPRSTSAQRKTCPLCLTPFAGHGLTKFCSVVCRDADHAIGTRMEKLMAHMPKACVSCDAWFTPLRPNQSVRCAQCQKQHTNLRALARWHRRRARMANTNVTTTVLTNLKATAMRCPLCQVGLTDDAKQPNAKQVDHIVPLNIGGTHTLDNVRVICRTCNLARPKDGSDLDQTQLFPKGGWVKD